MKKILTAMLAVLTILPMTLTAQSYNSLWKQVRQDQDRDLPQTALRHLRQVEAKAARERAYGHLLKATLLGMRLQAEVAPDSLAPAVDRLEQLERAATDTALQAVYAAVLSKVYATNSQLADDSRRRSDDCRRRALAHAGVLARVKAADYEPFVVEGADSEVFGNDLLSVIGMELEAWDWLDSYYRQAGNRRALCHLALRTADGISELDSLLAVYGDLPEADIIRKKRDNRWAAMTNPTFMLELERRVQEVGRQQTVHLRRLRNVESLTLRVYRTRLSGDTDLNPQVASDYQRMRSGLTELPQHAQTKRLGRHAPDEFFDDSLTLAALPAGVYLLECSTHPHTQVERTLYFVSGLRLMTQGLPDGTVRFVVVDATSGQSVSGATLRLTFSRGKSVKMLTTDERGEARYRPDEDYYRTVRVTTPTDTSLPTISDYSRYTYHEKRYGAAQTVLFTDRAIYRPGQTVSVTAIRWKELSATRQEAVEGETVHMELRDANYKVVAEQQAVTDRFGRCAVQFTLPTGQLNGRYTVRANGYSAAFQVEEYKRPAFQVEFADYRQAYRQGDTVSVEGKALTYAGVPVQEARVRYTVRRRVAFWWMNYSAYWETGAWGNSLHDTVLANGETVTADDGTFAVSVPLLLPDGIGRRTMFYHFVVEADVTDVAGETHHATLALPLGSRPSVLTADLPGQVRRDQLPAVTFARRNAAGHEIAGQVSYRLDGGPWHSCAANEPCSIFKGQLKSGSHRLDAVCEQDTLRTDFVVFSLDDKRPPVRTADWFYLSDEQFPADGSPVTLQVGSTDPDMYIVYTLFAGKRLVEGGAVRRSAQLVNRQFTYKEEYADGLLLTYAWVKNGECHQHQAFIRRPMPDRQLRMTWETFRDRLTPGQQEEWRLRVQHPDGSPAAASLLAVLYDKSLDAIRSHQWTLNTESTLAQPYSPLMWCTWSSIVLSAAQNLRLQPVRDFSYSLFDGSVLPTPGFSRRTMFVRGGALTRSAKQLTSAMPADEMLMAKAAMNDAAAAPEAATESIVVGYGVAGNADEEAKEAADDILLRENLQETAFCYPTLESDRTGTVTLRFTLPESLTTWRFMGIANTPDMEHGSISGETVARKDVMVQPNMPRFVRQGDDARLSARIVNTTDHAISGNAKLQLIDPQTEQVVYEQTQSVSTEAGKTAAVEFRLTVGDTPLSLAICRITVQGNGFSDGEQHYLPILPDREHITRTVPITQHEAGVKSVSLADLFPEGTTQRKLTVEYTNNPAWLMVQALPTLGQPSEHSAIDQAAAYYSNLLAKTLLDQNPQVKSVFEQWQRETSNHSPLPSNHSPLTSHLSKNQELKDLLLSETPWVADADRETEQRQRLADFFDDNAIGNRLQTAIAKLTKLQQADGSFAWYPGMKGSTAITVAVAETLTRLEQMAGTQPATQQLRDNAFGFLAREMTDRVAKMRQAEKKGATQTFPSFTALRWLYLCALDGRQLPKDVQAANDYLIALLKKDIKRQGIYEKALTAIVLARHNERQRAADYVRSLKEYTVYTDEMGRYYDTPRADYSWYDYRIPTEVAAIEAIRLLTPDDHQTIDEMRRWLLQEKRTQAWNTPINSINAIWAFLGTSETSKTSETSETSETSITSITSKTSETSITSETSAPSKTTAPSLASAPLAALAVDGKPLGSGSPTAALGYVKATLDSPDAQTFTATKTSDGTSWGAVYAQFLQKTADIGASQSGITVRRDIVVKHSGQADSTDHRSSLAVGDRVTVRITIETTRDLDFVQVVDRRAACMEPVRQLSGFHNGAYVSPKDCATHYFFSGLAKGRHIVETDYYIDRAGQYETGTCTVGCAYAPEFRATAPSEKLSVKDER